MYASNELGAPACSHSLRQQNVVMRAASTACGSTGARPCPQLPTATVVIPCITLDCARPSTSSVKSACEWMSTMPGATTMPVTSITSHPPTGAMSEPIAVIRSPSMATSARRGGEPVPSTTVPPESKSMLEPYSRWRDGPACRTRPGWAGRRNARRARAGTSHGVAQLDRGRARRARRPAAGAFRLADVLGDRRTAGAARGRGRARAQAETRTCRGAGAGRRGGGRAVLRARRRSRLAVADDARGGVGATRDRSRPGAARRRAAVAPVRRRHLPGLGARARLEGPGTADRPRGRTAGRDGLLHAPGPPDRLHGARGRGLRAAVRRARVQSRRDDGAGLHSARRDDAPGCARPGRARGSRSSNATAAPAS